ncbi:MAG: serine/threonine protein kinase [Deltaproteobacteria bacterium]|nr:serine/threonine protein kinase [Deltaproteobacteria bacterium]
MSSTPAQRFVCPRCRTAFEQPSHFCRECGADMTRASALEASRMPTEVDATREPSAPIATDRRVTDSNQAWLGKIVDGRYRVLEVIGRGGMGVVYRVEHLRMGKIAAMKVLHRDLAHDADVVSRFEREAAAISKLHHPHTVQVFDFGQVDGALYLIMELVRGQDLARIIERDGPMPWARAAPLLAQVCGALSEAHELGIVHRDLKPENVLITRTTDRRDYAKVLDFGLAKLDQRGTPTRETEKQAIVGTPYFMAPEQIRGDDVDARTDLYSFGALMFELLTAQHLYTGSTAVGVLTKHLTAEPDAPSMRVPKMAIPPEVDHLCRKALQRDPAKRWQTAAELAEAIEEVYAETVGDATGAGSGRRSAQPRSLSVGFPLDERSDHRLRRSDIDAYERGLVRRRWFTLVASGVVVLGLAAGAAWWVMREPPPLTEEREPNDEPALANRIAPNTAVTGYLGKRLSPSEGDRDAYLVRWPESGRRIVTIAVTGVPNLDLNLVLSDRNGVVAARIDEGGVGEGEVLHRRAVDGPIIVTVGQTMAKDQKLPVENVSDAYTLTVTEEAEQKGEVEPNGTEADANPLGLTDELRGYLDTRSDVDLIRWTGEPGTYTVTVRADNLPLVWQTGDGKRRTPGAATLALQKGEIIRIERDAKEPGPLKNRDAMWSIFVTK